jgi:hypothetical protein
MSTVRGSAAEQSFSVGPGKGRRYDGAWGSLDVTDVASARRSGMTRYRLEIFPPGTNSIERRQLRHFRAWRLWGAPIALIGEFLVGTVWPGWQGPLYLAVTYFAGLLLWLKLTQRLRKATRVVHVATILVGGRTHVEGNIELLESCATEFESLDRARAARSIDPVQYETAWAALYARLGADEHEVLQPRNPPETLSS